MTIFLPKTNRLFMLPVVLSAMFIVSCKPEGVAPLPSATSTKTKLIDSVNYQWGDLSSSRQTYTDIISYNSVGQIDSIYSKSNNQTDNNLRGIAFMYQGNKIILSTVYKDTYELDNAGRVALHSATHTEDPSFTYVNTEQYFYDAAGYLSKVVLLGNGAVYSTINYQVQNGNYTSYTLTNAGTNAITRKYDFSYSSQKINISFAIFTAIFGNNTYTAVEKYLNFGRQSVNLLSGIKYQVAELDGSTKTGTLNVNAQADAQGNFTQFSLAGNVITGTPADNLSPLPRVVTVTQK
jgi:hypothetical protein